MIEDLLTAGGKDLSLEFSKDQIKQFIEFMNLLKEWNERINLTSITDEVEIVIKHFLDSLLLLPFMPQRGSLADIGTGAGFPGIPIKIMLPEMRITLIDSLNKRVKFLQEVINSLGLSGIDAVHGRAEEIGRDNAFRAKFDIVVARAVSRLTILTEYCLPLVKTRGKFIAAKGPAVVDEVQEAGYAIELLGGKIKDIQKTCLPKTGDPRVIVVIEKIRVTPEKYPRQAGTPDKKPLIKPN